VEIKSLEGILKENNMQESRLSPYLKENYNLSDRFVYVAPMNDRPPPSDPEKEIMKYLDSKGIKYEFEIKLAVAEQNDEIHIRMPDFYIPALDLCIEFNGMEGDPKSDKRYRDKRAVYNKNGVNFREISKKAFNSGEWKEQLDEMLEDYPSTSSTGILKYAAMAASLLLGAFYFL